MSKFVSIIIPSYNRRDQLIACLKSIYQIIYDHYEVIVVDNGSIDDSVAKVRENFPQVRVVALTENRGAVGGRNEGMRHARGEYFCFVDSDNIVDENFLTELVVVGERDANIGFVGPKMYYYQDPKRIWCAGVRISLLTSHTTYIGINEIDKGQYCELVETDQIPNVWLVKRKVVERIGVMDSVYVMSYGESDWPMRAWRAGYSSLICPTAIVYHDIDLPTNVEENIMVRGTSFRIYYFARNRTIFMRRFSSIFQYFIFLIFFNNVFLCLYIATFIRAKKYSLIFTYLKGFIDGLKMSWNTKRVTNGTEFNKIMKL